MGGSFSLRGGEEELWARRRAPSHLEGRKGSDGRNGALLFTGAYGTSRDLTAFLRTQHSGPRQAAAPREFRLIEYGRLPRDLQKPPDVAQQFASAALDIVQFRWRQAFHFVPSGGCDLAQRADPALLAISRRLSASTFLARAFPPLRPIAAISDASNAFARAIPPIFPASAVSIVAIQRYGTVDSWKAQTKH